MRTGWDSEDFKLIFSRGVILFEQLVYELLLFCWEAFERSLYDWQYCKISRSMFELIFRLPFEWN